MSTSTPRPAPPALDSSVLPLAWWLAGALLLCPLLLAATLDWDRAQPLLLIPALLIAWRLGRAGTPPASKNETVLLALAALAWMVSTAFAPHVARALATGSAWLLIVAGAVVARRLAGRPAALRILFSALALSALLGLVIVRLRTSPTDGIPLYGHPRLLGLHLLAGAIAALGLLITLSSPSRASLAAHALLAAIITGGVWWSGGRAPLVGLAAGLAAWFWIATPATRTRLLRWLPLVLIGAFAVAFSLGHPTPAVGWDFAFGRTVEAQSLGALSSNRTAIWEIVCAQIQASPWIGHGADSYVFILPKLDGAQPHDFLMQWLLNFGLLGALPLAALLVLRLRHGLVKGDPAASPLVQLPVVGLVTCLVAGFFDGMFYHAVLFMPAALFAGLIIESRPFARLAWPAWPGRLLAIIAALILVLNGWLFLELHQPPPASPQAFSARALRAFPSNVHGLWNWLDAWKTRDPAAALEWSRWAGRYAISPELFGIYSARLQLEQKNYPASVAELQKILLYIDAPRKKSVEGMINEVRRKATQAGSPLPPP